MASTSPMIADVRVGQEKPNASPALRVILGVHAIPRGMAAGPLGATPTLQMVGEGAYVRV